MEPENVSRSLLSILTNRSNPALTAVVEEGYIDIDYSHSYFLQHGRSFTPSLRRTTRIHFFSSEFTIRRLRSMGKKTKKLLQKTFLGCTVIRPDTPRSLGRTFVRPPEISDGIELFFPTRAKFDVHLCGVSLDVEACPYISQDQLVMACATASLWMSSTSLAAKITDMREFTTCDITALALSLDRSYGPTVGGGGLRIQEMEHAFMAMGYDPFLSEYPEADQLLDSAYTYVESGIAPVLAVWFPEQDIGGRRLEGLHAVTIVGHIMDTANRKNRSINHGTYSSAAFVPGLIINDDQNGLYLRAAINPYSSKTDKFRSKIEILLSNGKLEGYCKSLLVPLPPRVLLSGELALRSAASLLSYTKSRGWLKSEPLILRPYLIHSAKLKEFFTYKRDVAGALAAAYRGIPMPRYVWVVEYGYLRDWRKHRVTDLAIQGEVLFDPTIVTAEPQYLSLHLPSLVTVNRVTPKDQIQTTSYNIVDDHPYLPLQIPIRP